MTDETYEEFWQRMKPITEGATPKEIGEMCFNRGIAIGRDAEARWQREAAGYKPIDSVSPNGARAI